MYQMTHKSPLSHIVTFLALITDYCDSSDTGERIIYLHLTTCSSNVEIQKLLYLNAKFKIAYRSSILNTCLKTSISNT